MHGLVVVELGPRLETGLGDPAIRLEDLGPVRRLIVDMLAGQGQDGVHQTAVFNGHLEQHILESILVLTLDSQDATEVVDIVMEKDHVFGCLHSLKDWLQSDEREAPATLCIAGVSIVEGIALAEWQGMDAPSSAFSLPLFQIVFSL